MKKIFLLFSSLCVALVSLAQNENDVVFTYNGTPVTVKEFTKAYQKYNLSKNVGQTEAEMRDNLMMYENYKIVVAEAHAQHLDTLPSIKAELGTYRKQLAKNYLVDKGMLEGIYKEVFDRNQFEVEVSHCVARCAIDASPKDTLAAYTKIKNMYDRVVNNKEDFAKVATESSEDPSVKTNHGNLGYFTAMQTPYTFENQMYKTAVGSVSGIFRTSLGYHFIKVTNKRPSQGQMLVTHILVACAKNASPATIEAARQKANRIYENVQKNPAMFEVYARDSSDDRQAAQNGGRLRWFKVNEMVTEFETAAFALKNNEDISAPVKTDYGYHIIKRIDRKGAETDFAKSRDQIKKLIDKDARFEEAKKAYLRQAKAEANFVQYTENLVAWVSALDSTVLKASFKASMNNVNKTLFKLGDKTYTTNDFANYVELSQRTPSRRSYTNSQDIALRLFSLYVDKCVLDYAESTLENKYPEFKDLMKDYTDGMILFDLKEKNVWSRSTTDTVGLKDYFKTYASNYIWGERLEANIYRCATSEIADEVIANIHPAFFKKLFGKKKIMSVEQMKLKYNTKDHPLDFGMDAGKFERGNNAFVDSVKAQVGIYKVYGADGAFHVIDVKKVITSTPKTFEEAKGYVIADYMANLEKTWMASLRDKYPVVENKSVVEALLKK